MNQPWAVLEDPSVRRHLQAAVERHVEQLRRDGMAPPVALADFLAWLRDTAVTNVEASRVEHRRALSRQSTARWRERLRAERQNAT